MSDPKRVLITEASSGLRRIVFLFMAVYTSSKFALEALRRAGATSRRRLESKA